MDRPAPAVVLVALAALALGACDRARDAGVPADAAVTATEPTPAAAGAARAATPRAAPAQAQVVAMARVAGVFAAAATFCDGSPAQVAMHREAALTALGALPPAQRATFERAYEAARSEQADVIAGDPDGARQHCGHALAPVRGGAPLPARD